MAPKTEKEIKLNIIAEVKQLPVKDLKEILDFVYFIKLKPRLDPDQAYFWTKMWQRLETEIEVDKKTGQVIGSGRANDLLKKLKHADQGL